MALTVSYGVNNRQIPHSDGITVGQIRSVMAPIIQIPKNASATLNGKHCSDSARPHDGDRIDFR